MSAMPVVGQLQKVMFACTAPVVGVQGCGGDMCSSRCAALFDWVTGWMGRWELGAGKEAKKLVMVVVGW